jgi:hypothetical protein
MTRWLIRKCMPALALAGAILLSLAPRADALLQAAAQIDGGAILRACDNVLAGGACGGGLATFSDTNAAIGTLSTAATTIGDITIEAAVQTSVKSPGAGGLNTLSSGGTVIANTGAVDHTILLTISDTSFVGPSSQFTVTGSGTWVDQSLPAVFGNTEITMEWWNDPANVQGANTPGDTPGFLVNTATNAPVDGISNQSFGGPGTGFNVSGALANPDPGDFSMTLDNTLVLGPGIRLESRSRHSQSLPRPRFCSSAALSR